MTPYPAQVVRRPPPVNLIPEDSALFAHEFEKAFSETAPWEGSWDYTGEGLLLKPGTGRVDVRSFQSGWPGGLAGRKVCLKGLFYRWSQPRRALNPAPGRRFLVITDEFSNGYFHWVTDGLPKLALLGSSLAEFDLVLPAFTKRFAYMTQSLAAWPELHYQVVDAKIRSALSDAVVLPALAPTGNYRPETILALGEIWRNTVHPQAPFRRLYVSRAKAPWRKIDNEAEVKQLLERHGFETVTLEDLDFSAQVKLLAETKTLVSNHGAGLTNLLFQTPGAQVLEIRQRGDAHNNCYYALAAAAGVTYAYVLADPVRASEDTHTADIVVNLKALEAGLLSLL
ncbi:MAG: glycosyltransferase family 61 protein [Spirochaetales bacterium]|nr:glycosyltransferase family 61 protein [Spirochaetales bacterium]